MPKKKKISNDLFVSFILDKSGSMQGLEDSTVAGFNQFVEEQVREDGKTYLSLTLFSTTLDVRYVATDIREIPPMARMGENAYYAGGGTALYDAVGTAIRGSELWLTNHPEFTGKVLVAVWTDGEENSSHSWRLHDVNALIEQKQKEGWIFAFLGTGSAAWTEGKKFASVGSVNVLYSEGSQTNSYKAFSNSASLLRTAAISGQEAFAGAVMDSYASLESEDAGK